MNVAIKLFHNVAIKNVTCTLQYLNFICFDEFFFESGSVLIRLKFNFNTDLINWIFDFPISSEIYFDGSCIINKVFHNINFKVNDIKMWSKKVSNSVLERNFRIGLSSLYTGFFVFIAVLFLLSASSFVNTITTVRNVRCTPKVDYEIRVHSSITLSLNRNKYIFKNTIWVIDIQLIIAWS